MTMFTDGKIKDGKKEYTIREFSLQDYLDYVEYSKSNLDGYKNLKYLISKAVYRVVELRLFKKAVWSKRIFDFTLEKIPISKMEDFQNDLVGVIFGQSFIRKIRKQGVDITKTLDQ